MNNLLSVLKTSSNVKKTESSEYSKVSYRSRKEENFKNVLNKVKKHDSNNKDNNKKYSDENTVNRHEQNREDDKSTLKTKKSENIDKENLQEVSTSKELNENNKITEKKEKVSLEDGSEQMVLPEAIENSLRQKIEKILELILSEDDTLSLDSIDSEKFKELCSKLMNELNSDLVGNTDKFESSMINNLTEIIKTLSEDESMINNFTEIIKTLSEDEKALFNNILEDYQTPNNINLGDSSGESKSVEDIKEMSQEFTERIIKELKHRLNSNTENVNNKMDNNVQNNSEINGANNLFDNTENNNGSRNAGSNNEFLDKESKILSSMIGKEDNCDKQINKVTNFMTQFIEAKDSLSEAANVESSSNITVNRNNFTGDIIKAVKFMTLNGMKDLTVKVVPKELGEVIINLTMESGIMKANISSTNKETVNILNANLQDISEKLNNSDIKIQNVTIDIYNDDTTFYSDQFAKNNGNSSGNKKGNNKERLSVDATEGENLVENDYKEDGNVNILA